MLQATRLVVLAAQGGQVFEAQEGWQTGGRCRMCETASERPVREKHPVSTFGRNHDPRAFLLFACQR